MYVYVAQVNHLESTGSALAEDVIQKSAIIQTYFMENKAGCQIATVTHTHTHTHTHT